MDPKNSQSEESYISNLREEINHSITNLLLNISPLEISPLIKYAITSDGKRLRPIISILSGQCAGADKKYLMNLALAFEMLHTATLVHDDIIDKDKLRRNIPSINEKWGYNSAILVGDALISLAIKLSASYGKDIIKVVADHGMQLCNGQYMDLSTDIDKMTEEQYLKKINGKSASLFRAVSKSGAMVASASNSVIEALSNFGESFGMAYQISDDLIDTIPNDNSISKDILDGRITLPLVYTYNKSTSEEKRKLKDIIISIRKDNTTSTAAELATEINTEMKNNDSIKYCKEKILNYVDAGKSALSPLQDNQYKKNLEDMINLLGDGQILPM